MLKKNILLFLILIITSFLLMTYQAKKGHLLTFDFINDLHSTSQMITKSLLDGIKKPFITMALRDEENKRLQKRIDELLIKGGKYQEAIYNNRRLKELLKLREGSKNYITTAKVIARGVDHWTDKVIIDKGLKDGVLKDMSAITPRGLAGKIINVSDSFSHLLLITDINFSAAVRLQKSRKEGIISGRGTGKCILKYILSEEEIKTGDIIITSGLDSLFPPGIPVGYVSKVDNEGNRGYFQYIELIPFQDHTKMEEVIIVK